MSNQNVSSRPTGLQYFLYKSAKALKTPTPYLAFLGITLWLVTYYLLCEQWRIFPFYKVPGPLEVITEWINKDPIWGTSLFTEDYYINIWVSCRRIFIAFALATGLGVPLGALYGLVTKI